MTPQYIFLYNSDFWKYVPSVYIQKLTWEIANKTNSFFGWFSSNMDKAMKQFQMHFMTKEMSYY